MAILILPDDIQTIETIVSGPGSANRLFIFAGTASAQVSANPNQQQNKETFRFLIGPTLTQAQFHRATASVSLAGFQIVVSNQVEGSLSAAYCNVGESEADWDDESGKIEVRFELNATAQGQAGIGIQRVTFNVSALVTLP